MGKGKEQKYEVAGILREYLSDYREKYRMSYEQTRAATAIMKCRTEQLGGIVKVCDKCGKWSFSFKSCKDRHCPKCGNFEKAQWIERQKVWLLPIRYFHVVFTIDHVFNPLVWRNQKMIYNLIIRTAVEKLREFGQEYLGGEIGITVVLHTWGQTMQPHLHCHFIVTGGALVKEEKRYRWQEAKHEFLFPAKRLSREYRDAFCEGVRRLWEGEKLDTGADGMKIEESLMAAKEKDWEVYIQPPICGVGKLLDYLGRYVYRIAISNHRIVKVERGEVAFEYYDNRDSGKLKTMQLSAVDFIGNFLMHVLPRRFMRIRHYGLHHGSCREKLKEARELLGIPKELPVMLKLKLVDWLMTILDTEEDPRLCPDCGEGLMLVVREFGPIPAWRVKMAAIIRTFLRWQHGFAT
ncbi:MAG: IS91 family transposase [Chloroflexi bacterium]|nr:IS91 family transposase [Chloroflexota bacterium]